MRALSHSGRPCAPGTPLACCLKGRYSVAVPSGGGGTGLSSQRWRTSKVFVPSSNTFKLICLRATALLSHSHSAPMVSHGGRPVPCHLTQKVYPQVDPRQAARVDHAPAGAACGGSC